MPTDPLTPEARARLEAEAELERRVVSPHLKGQLHKADYMAGFLAGYSASHDALGARIGELEGRMAYLAHVLNVVRRDATFDEHLSFVLKAAILIATKESAGLRAALSPPPTTPQEETPKPGLMVLGQFCAEIDRLSAALQAVEGRLERAEKALREIDRCPSDTTQEHLKGFARAYFEATP